jgi:periplasmic protein CpxP/Spy
MLKKLLVLPVMAFSFALASSPVIACGNMSDKSNCQCAAQSKDDKKSAQNMPCSCKHQKMNKMMESLNLTDDQKTKLDAIKQETKSQMKSLHEQMRSLRTEMKTLVHSDKMDEKKMNALINKKKELVAEKTKIKLQSKNKMYNLLNPQQKQQFNTMLNQWKQKKMDKMKSMMNSQDNDSSEQDSDTE